MVRKRPRVEPTDDFQQILPLCWWPEQADREQQEPRGARYRSLLASSDSGTVSACRWATFQSPSSRR